MITTCLRGGSHQAIKPFNLPVKFVGDATLRDQRCFNVGIRLLTFNGGADDDRTCQRYLKMKADISEDAVWNECACRFDHERYKLSKLLPDIIRNIGNRKCFFAKYDNFFVFELPEGIPDDSEYWIFFFLERADKDEGYALHLIVQSAYVGQRDRSPGGRRAKKITFRTLVSKVLAGEKPKPPP